MAEMLLHAIAGLYQKSNETRIKLWLFTLAEKQQKEFYRKEQTTLLLLRYCVQRLLMDFRYGWPMHWETKTLLYPRLCL
jgi:hypothetical protein